SDYTVFLNFLGIPVADMSFTGPYGVYHSAYDNHVWMSKFGDPGFRYHAALARLWGIVALRLANADVVPLDYVTYADRLREFVRETVDHVPAGERSEVSGLAAAADRFAQSAAAIQRRVDGVLGSNTLDASAAVALDRALLGAERALTDPAGIPGRPWYRHLIYAPKATYAAEVLPGVTEAIDANDRAAIADQARRVAAALDRAARVLDSAAAPTSPIR